MNFFANFYHNYQVFYFVLLAGKLPLTPPISDIFLKFLKFQSSLSHIVRQLVTQHAYALYGNNSIVLL